MTMTDAEYWAMKIANTPDDVLYPDGKYEEDDPLTAEELEAIRIENLPDDVLYPDGRYNYDAVFEEFIAVCAMKVQNGELSIEAAAVNAATSEFAKLNHLDVDFIRLHLTNALEQSEPQSTLSF